MKLASVFVRLDNTPRFAKAATVIAGYVAAFCATWIIYLVYVKATSGPDRETYAAMYDYGDSLLFLFALGALATLPTCLALYFLRKSDSFWSAACTFAVAMSVTGLGAIAEMMAMRMGLRPGILAIFAVPRIFISPILAAMFALSGLISPTTKGRRWLLGAAGIECVTIAYAFFHFFAPMISSQLT